MLLSMRRARGGTLDSARAPCAPGVMVKHTASLGMDSGVAASPNSTATPAAQAAMLIKSVTCRLLKPHVG
jgi:hypothetical protein